MAIKTVTTKVINVNVSTETAAKIAQAAKYAKMKVDDFIIKTLEDAVQGVEIPQKKRPVARKE